MKPSRIATILVVLAIFAILAVPAAAFHVAYDYVAYASDGDDITSVDIPHSMMGSEIDYKELDRQKQAGQPNEIEQVNAIDDQKDNP